MKILLFFLFLSTSLYSNQFSDYLQQVETSANWLKKQTHSQPVLLMVLSGGINGPLNQLTNRVEINSKDIPHFPIARAQGHEGKLIFGQLHGKDVVIMKGRYHYYEGLSAQKVVFPYFVLHAMGVKNVITISAVGGIRYDLVPGDIMMVSDHINHLPDNCLRGLCVLYPNHQFADMTQAYHPSLQAIALRAAKILNLPLKQGVYLATAGPNYETKSEIRMFRSFGADVVGMSTVFEVIACNFLKMKILALACITNPAADRHEGNMDHEEVLLSMKQSEKRLSSLITQCAEEILR